MAEFKNSGENMKDFRVFGYSVSSVRATAEHRPRLVSEGRKLADDLGVEPAGLLVGDQVKAWQRKLAHMAQTR